ncbi:MAG: GNAT family N-acetyltransferase [Leptolyngbya sp. SIO1D8]|nr:GNAT family N-acetyltransferase [Leptolyngbya sp. SIO1D8]
MVSRKWDAPDGSAVGVAIWKPKENRTAKLSTLFVTEEYRRSGIGRNLILTCLEQWKMEKIRRAFVTTAKVELVPFFERYGFWVEGIGREIYERERHEPEWFLTKLLFDNADRNSLDTVDKAKILFPEIIKSSYVSGRRKVEQIETSNAVISLKASDGTVINKFSLHAWFNLTYPAESLFTPQTAYIIPIRPQFLIQIFQAGKTVYYGVPRFANDEITGSLIIFYASSPISGVVAIARIVNRYIGKPTDLYNHLGMKGVLNLQEIGNERQIRQAVEFDHLMPLLQAVNLSELISNGVLNGTPQSMHSLPMDRYKKAVEIGGIYAG